MCIRDRNNYKIEGLETTLPFGKFVCEHEAFISGNFDTHFVKNNYTPAQIAAKYKKEKEIAALVGLKLYLEDKKKLKISTSNTSNWSKNRI